MQDEKKIIGNSRPIDAEKLFDILEFAKKCMCKIKYLKKGITPVGSGFFCQLNIEEINFINRKFLMTNNHVINLKYLQNNNELYFENNKENYVLNLKNRYYFTNKKYDFTIIEIKDSDNIKNISFYELFENIMNINSKINFINHDVFIPQFPNGGNLSIAFGAIKNINFIIHHTVSTEYGSSGSPILSLDNYRLIGLHNQRDSDLNENKGIFFKDIIICIKIGGDFDISNLKLLKTIQSNIKITDLILLNNGKICIKDIMGNVKIYDDVNFNMQIEIKSEINEPIKFSNFYHFSEEGNTLVLDKYDRIIFTNKTNIINVVEIIYPNKYNIIQKIPFEKEYCCLFIYEKYLIATYDNYKFNVYSYNNSKYEEIDNTNFIKNLVLNERFMNMCYFEKYAFKDWEFIIGADADFLVKKTNKKKYKAYPIGYHDGYFNFSKNQILFIEPSYIAFGNRLALIDLNKVKEEIEENNANISLYSLLMKEEVCFLSQYQNLDRELIIYINKDSILKQGRAFIKDETLDIELLKERKDIKIDYFIRKDDLLFILFSGNISIFQFSNV